MNKVIKFSASEISSLLCYPMRLNPFLPKNVQNAIQTGSFLHLKLGFTNSKQFTRVYEIEGQSVEIVGIPDKLDYENGIVEELKTFHTQQSHYRNRKVAFVQLIVYQFLTGLKKGKGIMFDVKEGKVIETIEANYSDIVFEKILRKALKLKKIQTDFLDFFNKVQKEESDEKEK